MQKILQWLNALDSKKRKQLYLVGGLVAILLGVLLSNSSAPKVQDAIVQQSENFTVSGDVFIHVVGEVLSPAYTSFPMVQGFETLSMLPGVLPPRPFSRAST